MAAPPLSILFAGQAATATLLDDTTVPVFVRAMPQRWLARVIECAEFKHALVELCTYTKEEPAAGSAPAYPDIPPPAGYAPVPPGWSDNLTDASVDLLYELAQGLNFSRAVAWAEGQIAAKKLVAPLHEKAIHQVLPLALRVMDPLMQRLDALSNSMPKSPSSPASPANSS